MKCNEYQDKLNLIEEKYHKTICFVDDQENKKLLKEVSREYK
jgi:hypothetical protein